MNSSYRSLLVLAVLATTVTCKLLKDEPQCGLTKICGNRPSATELDSLECVQRHKASDFTEECRNIVREHARNFFKNSNLRRTLNMLCSDDIKAVKCEPEQKLIFCVLEQKDKVLNEFYCQYIIQRVEDLLTTNFGLVSDFKKICEYDIKKIHCNPREQNEFSLTVLEDDGVLDCLQKHSETITNSSCKQEIQRISSFQGDDAKLDNLLLASCSKERRTLCSQLSENDDFFVIYKCIQKFVNDPDLSPKCREQVFKQEKRIPKESKVSKGLVRACRDDIRTYRCRRMISDDRGVRLAQMLLCLENAAHNGSRITLECRSEMVRHRKFLMEDYRLSPEVVIRCSEDIENFCRSLEVGGKTIHCLMEHSHPKRRRQKVVSVGCQRALENLLKITDAGADWRVDPVLRSACESVVRHLCPDTSEEVKVMSCLMDNINSDDMVEDCKSAVMQIQYFISRDFKLDPQLFASCKEDAVRVCHAKNSWNDDPNNMDPERGPLVLPCLYRYVYNTHSDIKLKVECRDEVKRVMRQRAIDVELIPEIEESCMDDLVTYCSEKKGPGGEMLCLQDKYTSLKPRCKMAVGNFTEAEAADINLNPIVKTYCRLVIDSHCKEELQNVKGADSNDVMGCLIRHKNDADVRIHYKCRAAIEHFQLISLNDYHFTVAFKEACRSYVIRYCPKAHTKAQVVECLSEVTQNDTIKDEKYKLSKECRYQLRGQLLQQREFIELDPKLKTACEKDIKSLCGKPELKSSQVLECLVEHINTLSTPCHKVVFRIEQHDFTDSSSDYTLLTTCKQMIKEYCKGSDTSQALTCLKKFKDEPVFDSNCRSLVLKRMVEQSADYRLNPALQRGCSQDIGKFCLSVLKNHLPDVEFEGKILHCLKVKFRERKLRKECEKQLSIILKESALNYKLNPLLRNLCTNEITEICGKDVAAEEQGESGKVEECLKIAFVDGRITNRACRLEVAGLIEEGKADIHVDPILHQACALDITKYCIDVPQGAGRVLQCLQTILSSDKQSLQPDCKSKLSMRMEMFKNAEPLINEPKNFQELFGHVSRSPSKKYFVASLFSIVGVIFMLGLFCGRVTRRSAMLKNK